MNATMKATHITPTHSSCWPSRSAHCKRADGEPQSLCVLVSVKSANQVKDIKGSSTDIVTQNKVLSVQLSGSPRIKDTRVVKWADCGRDLEGHALSTISFGENPLALSSNGQQTVERKSISTTYTPEHSDVSKSSGRSRSRSKKVLAEGVRYVGYCARMLDDDTVVGKASDPVGIKQEVANRT
jgi:hypothetical protein